MSDELVSGAEQARKILDDALPMMMTRLAKIAETGDDKVAVQAIKVGLEYSLEKPKQSVAVSGEEEGDDRKIEICILR